MMVRLQGQRDAGAGTLAVGRGVFDIRASAGLPFLEHAGDAHAEGAEVFFRFNRGQSDAIFSLTCTKQSTTKHSNHTKQ